MAEAQPQVTQVTQMTQMTAGTTGCPGLRHGTQPVYL